MSARMPQSGFLTDYSDFEKVDGAKGLYIRKAPGIDISYYSKIIIAPVEIYFDTESARIPEEKLAEMREGLHDGLSEALGKTFEVVNEPADDVLAVRTAITDVRANKVYLNLHWSTALSGLGIGGATIEAQFTDSVTGRPVVSVVSAKKGRRLKYFSGLTKWGHTSAVLDGWAQFLTDSLEISGKEGAVAGGAI